MNALNMDLFYIFISLIIILASLYYCLIWNYNYFQKQGVPCANGLVPLFGNMWYVFSQKENFPTFIQRLYKEGEGHSMIGFYQMGRPKLLIRDPELIKTVLLTNFSSFQENDLRIEPPQDSLLNIDPFFIKNETWREKRNSFSKGFSSKNLKIMLKSISEVQLKLLNYLDKKYDSENDELELYTLFSKYICEISAAAGIGIDGYCFEDEFSQLQINEHQFKIGEVNQSKLNFEKLGQLAFESSSLFSELRQLIAFSVPSLARFIELRIVPKKVEIFFQKTVKDLISSRKLQEKTCNDFLQVMMNYLKSKEQSHIDEDKALTAYFISLFEELYENTLVSMSFLGFQLAAHPEIQEKVREEIKSVLIKYDGILNYEALQEITYIEQVLKESMRHNNLVGMIRKTCTSECQLVGSDGLSCKIEKGNAVVISTYGLNMDPKYFPDPEKFDPERFTDDRMKSLPKFVFLPFGGGSRMCVGMKFAIMIIKVGIISILRKYSLEISPQASFSTKQDPKKFFYVPKGKLWVIVKSLKKNSS